jgi:CRISPR-associated protein Cas2
MPRKNRYTGVLKPQALGRGSPEVSCFLIYDIEDDKLRTRAADICMNYGLDRIQFSAFFGKLNRNLRQELCLRLQRELGKKSARVRIIPVCQTDLKDMWVLDQYRPEQPPSEPSVDGADYSPLKPEKPRLKVLTQDT